MIFKNLLIIIIFYEYKKLLIRGDISSVIDKFD